MIVAFVARHAEHAERETDRYAAWEASLRRLRRDWVRGERPAADQLGTYLREVPEETRPEAFADLIAEHLQLSWRAGPGPRLEAYFAESDDEPSAMCCPSRVPADLVEDEFLARHQLPYGDTPSLDEYQSRFPGRKDAMELLEGRCLGEGRYVKLSKRGQGALGEVWEAHDRALLRPVAIKTPRAHIAKDPAAARMLAEEARITASLEHPGIAGVHEFYPSSGDAPPFCVLRLLSGRTLGERIRDFHAPAEVGSRSDHRRVWRQLLRSFAAACDAVAYAHARGVLHRDLKPGNILLGDFGETVVLDWGLAKETVLPVPLAGNTKSCAEEGTPEYMAPEQAEGISDIRSDVFGLGAVLYELLTGRPPRQWDGGRRPDDWLAIAQVQKIQTPRTLNPRTPWALDAICRKALATDRSARYPSASALAQDIRRYMDGEAVEAQPPSVLSRVARWFRAWLAERRRPDAL